MLKKKKTKKAGQQMKNGRHNFKSASVCEFEKYSGKYMKKYKREQFKRLNGIKQEKIQKLMKKGVDGFPRAHNIV